MRNVAFVCLGAYHQIGGTELQMVEVMNELAKKPGYRVSCITADFGTGKKEVKNNVTVYASFPLRKSFSTLPWAPYTLWRVLRDIQPDIILSSPAGAEVGLLALYARIYNIPYVFRAASDVDCTKEKEATMDMLTAWLYRTGIRLATTIVVQHEKQQHNMKKYYGRDSVIISNGYSLPPTISIAERKKENSPILWVGSARHVKRADIFFSVVESLPHRQFAMVLSASGDKKLFETWRKQAASYPNLTFLGELSLEEVQKHIAHASLLVGTSDYEGSPNTYIMAYLLKTPVVSLNVDCTGLFAHGSREQLIKYIEQLFQDTILYDQLVSDAWKNARNRHDITRVILDWISVIRTTNSVE